MHLTAAQKAEIAKYDMAYSHDNYRMGASRRTAAESVLLEVGAGGGYLDVGCGRGEMLDFAAQMGFDPVCGVETCPRLLGGRVIEAPAWDLPYEDNAFEVVTLFDVIEHLLPGDDERACREMARVASRAVVLTACNRSSKVCGVELHVNRRPYEEWDRLFRQWFPGEVTWWSGGRGIISETWRIDL